MIKAILSCFVPLAVLSFNFHLVVELANFHLSFHCFIGSFWMIETTFGSTLNNWIQLYSLKWTLKGLRFDRKAPNEKSPMLEKSSI